MKFDDILIHIGEFGLYQKKLYLLLCMPSVINGCFMMILVFIMQPPEHRCKIPGYENDTYAIQGPEHERLVNLTIPPYTDHNHVYEKCTYYNSPYVSNRSEVKCDEWVYDTSVFTETFTSKHNLVCGDSIKTSVTQMIYYFGVLVGDLLFGFLADIIGRKKTFMISVVVLLTSGYAAAFAPGFISFTVIEFIVGAGMHGAFIICTVLGVELVGPTKRMWAGIVIHIFFAIGLVYLAGLEYFLRHWRWVQIGSTTPVIFFLAYWWLICESPRWLITKDKYEEAENILKAAAKTNKVTLPEKCVDSSTIANKKSESVLELFKSRILLKRTMIIFYNWAVISMVYYGVTMHAGNLGGNFYLNFFILAIVEFPAKFLTLVFLNRTGRKHLHCVCMIVGGTACLCTIFTVIYGGEKLQPLTLVLAIIGKCGAAAAFGVIYTYSLELYPTVLRNSGMGMSSCIARIGGMLAPYVAHSGELVDGKFGKALPLVIFGATSVVAGFLTLYLPETLGRTLPETIADAEEFGKSENDRDRKKSQELYVYENNTVDDNDKVDIHM